MTDASVVLGYLDPDNFGGGETRLDREGALEAFEGKMAEMGRFCIHPDWSDADILPERPGLECWASEASKAGSSDKYMLAADGAYLARNASVPPTNTWLFWDGDLLREGVQIVAVEPCVVVQPTKEIPNDVRDDTMLHIDDIEDP